MRLPPRAANEMRLRGSFPAFASGGSFARSGWNRPSTAYMRSMRTSNSIGIVVGIALGVPIGLALDSIGAGIGIGLALAIAAGWLLGDRE
jgi:hypothetical protein